MPLSFVGLSLLLLPTLMTVLFSCTNSTNVWESGLNLGRSASDRKCNDLTITLPSEHVKDSVAGAESMITGAPNSRSSSSVAARS